MAKRKIYRSSRVHTRTLANSHGVIKLTVFARATSPNCYFCSEERKEIHYERVPPSDKPPWPLVKKRKQTRARGERKKSSLSKHRSSVKRKILMEIACFLWRQGNARYSGSRDPNELLTQQATYIAIDHPLREAECS